ncbi:hypothetical protein GVX76_03255 [[Haemophilus] felis]|nr:hypothetical protein [[Haemophilus] felis]
MLANLAFQNSFVEFVYYAVLSQSSKSRLEQMLTDSTIKQVFTKNTIKKCIVKTKPQQVIVFVAFQRNYFVIKGFQFGRTDFLTGRKKAHLNTIQDVLTTKTPDEIEQYY